MFKWTEASVEELAQHIAKCSSQHTYAVLRYHTEKGNISFVEKLKLARFLAKTYRKIAAAKKVLEEHNQED